ncbi:MAG: MarR family transcriptional regulator, partial [Alphaproteobacteria bacterium]
MDEQVPWVQQQADPLAPRDDDLRHAMELLFFAYRDFTGEADAVLADYDMGRAHHRAVYFIGANTGISVSELLAILKITKQSLNRVLSTLIDEGYVVQETDDGDRRRRLMHLTPKGRDLEQLLTRRQSA